MSIPSLELAEQLLKEAESRNPGPWVQHSRNVALAAKLIAENHPSLDPHRSFILGLLHDIGRREGVHHIRHVLDGYRFLYEMGYEDAARISITHAFPIAKIEAYFGENDCEPEELKFLEDFLSKLEFNDYDYLIQLCDAISLSTGFCLMEKRLVEVVLRNGINELAIEAWRARFQSLSEIENEINQSVYALLPDVVEGTFGQEIT